MTSSAPPDDWFLAALRRAGDEDCPPPRPDHLHDITQARRMSPAEHLAALDDLMIVIEGLGIPPRVEEPVACGTLRL